MGAERHHFDSTVLETDSSGSVVSTQQYGAYGSKRGGSSTLSTDHHFTGQKLDGTGLLYYNARYFDPELGIFISPDTMIPDPGLVIDYNRYAYVRANPMKYQDPSGNFVETLWDAANVGIGIASLSYNVYNGN